jgi:hypothetical protein
MTTEAAVLNVKGPNEEESKALGARIGLGQLNDSPLYRAAV